jgi:hypothetical protein
MPTSFFHKGAYSIRLFACFFLYFLVFYTSLAQTEEPFVLSPRIGTDIDSLEAEYFNLFPDLDNVKGAAYRIDNLGNLQMLVSLSNGQDTTVTFSVLGTQELQKYIDNFEILPDNVKLINWNLLPGFDPGKRNFYESFGAQMFVYSGKEMRAGRLLKITDNHVYLWKQTKFFRPDAFPANVEKIPALDITKMERKQDLTGKIFGMSIGAGIGIAIMNPASLFGADNLTLDNTVYLMAGGAIIGAALGWFYDLLSISRRKYKINNDPALYLKAKNKLQHRTKFSAIGPPELKTLK